MATGIITKYMDGTDSGWVTLNDTYITGAVSYSARYHKVGNIVFMRFGATRLKADLADNGSITLGKVPSELIPTFTPYFFINTLNKGSGWGTVQSNGNIDIYNISGNTWEGGSDGDRLYFYAIYLLV